MRMGWRRAASAGEGHSRRMTDYRRTRRARRQSWYGLKAPVKRLLAQPAVHPALRVAARVAPGLPVWRLPAPSTLREVTGRADGAAFVLLDPARCEVAKELYWGSGRRPRPADAFALDLVVALARRSDVLLDVGAYTGLFTVAATAANPELRAHAFEIVPAVTHTLRRNVERNGVADRVTVHAEGVGATGTTMRVPTGEGGSALPSFYSARMDFDTGVDVPFVALDSLVETVGPAGTRVVMKIDVEGAENVVLAHGQVFLDRFRPDLLCEVLEAVADGTELEELLSPHGYRYYLVRAWDLLPCEHLVPHPELRDWLLTTRSAEDLERLGVRVSEPEGRAAAAPRAPSAGTGPAAAPR